VKNSRSPDTIQNFKLFLVSEDLSIKVQIQVSPLNAKIASLLKFYFVKLNITSAIPSNLAELFSLKKHFSIQSIMAENGIFLILTKSKQIIKHLNHMYMYWWTTKP